MSKQEQSPYIKRRTREVADIHYYLVGEIYDAEQHIDLLTELETASEDDTITIHINSPGGCANTAIQIMDAIGRSDAHVVTTIEGAAASAASMIFLKGHAMSVAPHSCMMVHTWSSWANGKSQEIVSNVMFNKARFEALFADVYDGFLTKKEISELAMGIDIYLTADQIMERLKKKYETSD